jgi:mannose-6-phosphate isomerase
VPTPHPLIFKPIYQPRVWGGRRLGELFAKSLPAGTDPIGESWEVVDLDEGQSVVATGPATGMSLTELVAAWGTDLLGRAPLVEGRFPLLIKFLDARANLSVQVHPSPAEATRLGGSVRVKHEAWYVLEADDDGAIYHDLTPGTTREAFQAAVADGSAASLLRRIPVRPGQCYYVPSGTVHALGAGVVVAEIQTQSDTTFRVYDWDRVGTDGKPRELHVEQALASIRCGEPVEPQQPRTHVAGPFTTVTHLVTCPYFKIERVQFSGGVEQEIPYAELVTWIVLTGQGSVSYGSGADTGTIPFKPGDTVVLPAALTNARIKTETDCTWLEVTVPTPSDLADYPRPAAAALNAQPGTPAAPIMPGIQTSNDPVIKAQVDAQIKQNVTEFERGEGVNARKAMRENADEFGIKINS